MSSGASSSSRAPNNVGVVDLSTPTTLSTLGARLSSTAPALLAEGLTPGLAIGLVTPSAVWCEGYGHLSADISSFEAGPDTVYDLASLTKVLATTVLLADAVAAGVVDLHERPWPRWPLVTVEAAARHEAGLPAWRPFFEGRSTAALSSPSRSREEVVEAVLSTSLTWSPGERTVYSDLGFIALGALLEDRLGETLDVLLAKHALTAGTGLCFVPLATTGYHPALPLVAPTEHCAWRRRRIQGEVHDDNAFAMGGVAGHAGLFGSVADVVVATQRIQHRLADVDDVLHRFAFAPCRRAGQRPIGFDRGTADGSTGGALGPHTVGHLGFTGTSIWWSADFRDAGDVDVEVAAADDHGGTVAARPLAMVVLSTTVFGGREETVARNKRLRLPLHRALHSA